jgi:hypothetical protein
MLGDGDVDESSTVVLEDHKDKEQPKRHRGHDPRTYITSIDTISTVLLVGTG